MANQEGKDPLRALGASTTSALTNIAMGPFGMAVQMGASEPIDTGIRKLFGVASDAPSALTTTAPQAAAKAAPPMPRMPQQMAPPIQRPLPRPIMRRSQLPALQRAAYPTQEDYAVWPSTLQSYR